MNVTAIIPAAGIGQRMQHRLKKPYITLRGKPILAYTLEVLDRIAAVRKIVIPVFPGEEQRCREDIISTINLRKPVEVIAGGERRQDSVRNGLGAVSEDCDLVLVHDGARPLVTRAMMETSITATMTKKATTMAVPVKDTITIVDKQTGTISRTPERGSLYSIQTPQTFSREILLRAHHAAVADGFTGTDDASLVERLGIAVTVLMGSYSNIKITTPEDLLIAEAFMQGRNT